MSGKTQSIGNVLVLDGHEALAIGRNELSQRFADEWNTTVDDQANLIYATVVYRLELERSANSDRNVGNVAGKVRL